MGKSLKSLMQIFAESAESAESAKQIFATFATYASAIFVGKGSNESTVRYALWSRISLTKPLQNPYLTLTRFRLTLGSNLSRISLASLICLCMLTVGVGNAWGADLTISLNFNQASGGNLFSLRTSSGNDASTETSKTYGGYTYKLKAANSCYYYSGNVSGTKYKCLFMGKTDSYIVFPAISDKKLTKVTIGISIGSSTATVAICEGNTSTVTTGGAGDNSWAKGETHSWTLTKTSANTAYSARVTSNHNIQITTIELEYTNVGGGGGCTAGVASSISAGDVVLIYYPNASKEFGGYAESGASHWGDIHTYTTNPSGYYPFTVEAGSASGYWSFKNGTTYLAMSADGNNKLVGSATKNDASSWTVSINGSGEATITNKAYTGRVLKYNTSSPRFSSYQTSTLNTAWPKIYKYCDDVTYRVTYYGNENTGGTVPIDNTEYTSAQSATVLGNTGSLVKTGYAWAGWNTKADGGGTTYTTGNTISMSGGSVSLYAKWVPTYTVTWMVNGSEARTDNNIGSGTALTPPTISPLPCGDKLAGWTDAEGGNYTHGTSTLYTGATITITGDKTFYAVFADYAD